MYSTKQLLTSLLQFFAMNGDAQIDYAKGIPSTPGELNFPFGLDHSPLLELANGCHNIARALAIEKEVTSQAVEVLEEFEAVVELMLCHHPVDYGIADSLRNSVEWRLVRKLSRSCLQELGIAPAHPAITYEELVPFIMD